MEFQEDQFTEVIVAGTNMMDVYEGFEADFEGMDDFATEVGDAMFSHKFAQTRAGYGTRAQISKDVKAVTYFALSRRFLSALQETESEMTRVTSAVTRPKIDLPEQISKAVNTIGHVETNGRKFKPRDLRKAAVQALLTAFHYAPDTAAAQYTNDTLGTLANVDFSLLTFDAGGDIAAWRSMNLKERAKALAISLLQKDADEAYTLAQRALEISTDLELIEVERKVIGESLLTRGEIDALYPQNQDPQDNNHRNAVRAITGDSQFTGAAGSTINVARLRARIAVLVRMTMKLKRDFHDIVKFLPMPSYESGDESQLAGYDADNELVESLTQLSVRSVGVGTALRTTVRNFGPHRRALDAIGAIIRSMIVNKGLAE